MKKIIISGFGGQGVLSLGVLIAQSAMNMSYNTSWFPSYGPEMRGGTAHCSVVYSRSEITSPVITSPNFAVVMYEPALRKFEERMEPGGVLILNSSIIRAKAKRTDIRAIYAPMEELCAKINPRGANIIALGILTELFHSLDVDTVRKAISQVFESKPELLDMNLKCFDAGREFIKSYK